MYHPETVTLRCFGHHVEEPTRATQRYWETTLKTNNDQKQKVCGLPCLEAHCGGTTF